MKRVYIAYSMCNNKPYAVFSDFPRAEKFAVEHKCNVREFFIDGLDIGWINDCDYWDKKQENGK